MPAFTLTWEWGFAAALFALDFTIRVFAIIYVPRNRRPQTATAWLLAIMFIPYVGLIAFFLFGSRRVPKARRLRQREVNEFVTQARAELRPEYPLTEGPPWLATMVTLNENLGALPMLDGNRAELLPDYEESIARMAEEVDGAVREVRAEFYILSFDSTTAIFFDALEAAARRGVTVRVMLDHVAAVRSVGYLRTLRRLRAAGVEWQLMLPLQPWRWKWQRPDLRNHRKLLVVDADVAYVGSQNLIDSSYNKRGNIRRGRRWKDLMVRFEGPIAAELSTLFVSDWYAETGVLLPVDTEVVAPVDAGDHDSVAAQVVPSGPGFDGENNLRLFNALLYAARERAIICSPYFVPDDSMLYAITTAAEAGVDVQLFVSEVGDQAITHHAQRSYYETLLRSGVRIWLYRAPTILHAKHFTIDDEIAVVGSSNMDMRSFSLNYEVSVMVQSPDFVARMRRLEDAYRTNSRELTLDEWLTRPWITQVLDNTARLTAAVQ